MIYTKSNFRRKEIKIFLSKPVVSQKSEQRSKSTRKSGTSFLSHPNALKKEKKTNLQ
jgi:hypothetical protein